MAASKSLTDEQRVMRARVAAHESWANTENRAARATQGHKASPASVDYWLERVDPDGTMTDETRRQAAESKRDAYMTRLALNASKARTRKGAGPNEAA